MFDFNCLEIERVWKRKRLNVYLNLYFYLSEHQNLLKDEKIRVIYNDVSKVYRQYIEFHLSVDKTWICPKRKINEKDAENFIQFITS